MKYVFSFADINERYAAPYTICLRTSYPHSFFCETIPNIQRKILALAYLYELVATECRSVLMKVKYINQLKMVINLSFCIFKKLAQCLL